MTPNAEACCGLFASGAEKADWPNIPVVPEPKVFGPGPEPEVPPSERLPKAGTDDSEFIESSGVVSGALGVGAPNPKPGLALNFAKPPEENAFVLVPLVAGAKTEAGLLACPKADVWELNNEKGC